MPPIPQSPLSGVRWSVQDRLGHLVYITEERWQHIIDTANHPEMDDFEDELQETIKHGHRKQDRTHPRKFRYSKGFDHLFEDNDHIVAIVLFRFREFDQTQIAPNNYIVTAFQKALR
jgi:hypothetical protein